MGFNRAWATGGEWAFTIEVLKKNVFFMHHLGNDYKNIQNLIFTSVASKKIILCLSFKSKAKHLKNKATVLKKENRLISTASGVKANTMSRVPAMASIDVCRLV